MKNPLLLVVSLCLITLASCQKKQYAYFQNSSQPQYTQTTKKAVVPVADATTTQAEEIALPAAPAETFSASNTEATITETETVVAEKAATVENNTAAPKAAVKTKMTFFQKVKAVNQLKKLSKQVSKKTSAIAPKGNPDTTALISLIAGIAGIVLLWAVPGLGILLGLLALILGAVSLGRTNKRGMSIAGIILGGLTLLISLILVIFVAAIFAAAL